MAKRSYIYTKIQTLFKNQDNLRYFLFTKIHTLYVRPFSRNFWNWHLYIHKKNDTLRYVTFYIQKSKHFEKSSLFALHSFIYKNPDNLRYAIFHSMFVIGGG